MYDTARSFGYDNLEDYSEVLAYNRCRELRDSLRSRGIPVDDTEIKLCHPKSWHVIRVVPLALSALAD